MQRLRKDEAQFVVGGCNCICCRDYEIGPANYFAGKYEEEDIQKFRFGTCAPINLGQFYNAQDCETACNADVFWKYVGCFD